MLVWSLLFSTANKLSARDMWALPQICLLCVQFHWQSSAAVNQVHPHACPASKKEKGAFHLFLQTPLLPFPSCFMSKDFFVNAFCLRNAALFPHLVLLCLIPLSYSCPRPTFLSAAPPPPPPPLIMRTRGPYRRHSHCSVVWTSWSCSSIDNSPAVAELMASTSGSVFASRSSTLLSRIHQGTRPGAAHCHG